MDTLTVVATLESTLIASDNEPSLLACAPFVGMLLSIALIPLFKPRWWEKNLLLVAIFWSLCFFIPYTLLSGFEPAAHELLQTIVLDYLPFIVLIWGLYAVTGGIVLRSSIPATPAVNLAFLLIGTLLASWVGTTGASMILIRTVLRANAWRQQRAHIVVFFIFLVANIGGCLTPLGDPPLFLGFLRGVPFFWTFQLLPIMLFNAAILLVVFYVIDRRKYGKELAQGRRPEVQDSKGEGRRVQFFGLHNLIFLAVIIAAVMLSGVLASSNILRDVQTGEIFAIPLPFDISLPLNNAIQMVIILVAGSLAVCTTKQEHHQFNEFSWEPIKEVASLFIGIFITMIPVLELLRIYGPNLGLYQPWQFFWVTGALSSFLDNAPTYLVFFTAAASLGLEGVDTAVGSMSAPLLMAVSAGAVFMGANTYIGNAPNFMVRSIAEQQQVKMPGFFAYVGWSAAVLIPLFIFDTLIFFI